MLFFLIVSIATLYLVIPNQLYVAYASIFYIYIFLSCLFISKLRVYSVSIYSAVSMLNFENIAL